VQVLVRPDRGRQAYRVLFHVRTPARCRPDVHERLRYQALGRMIPRLATQGWEFISLSPQPPRGPLPVVPLKGAGHRPSTGAKTPMDKDDALWRVSTLPDFGPVAPHLLTDEVEWEYGAYFERDTIVTEVLQEDHDAAGHH
jgi:hypothetical protein